MITSNASKDEPLVIYHIEGRRSFRVIWLCEELGLPYKLMFQPGDIFGSMGMLRKDHPLMPITPAVRHRGEFMVESGAILDVLAARYGQGRFVPDVESDDYARHQQWMHFSEATLMSRASSTRFVSMVMDVSVDSLPQGYRAGVPQKMPETMGPLAFFELTIGVRGMFDFIEDYLSRYPYFGGSAFTAADIMMHFAVRGAKLMVWIDPEDYPSIRKWKHEVEARPAFARANKAATPTGANEFGLPEGHPLPFSPPPAKAAE
jgi:glutathione S-transferase